MRLLFCSDPNDHRAPDPDFSEQVTAARAAGFELSLFSYEELVGERDARMATRGLKAEGETCIIRGWMLTPERYSALHHALVERGFSPLTSPDQYIYSHHLPGWYADFERHTARTVFVDAARLDLPTALDALAQLPPGGAIVKDYVKSWKHLWHEACFIPDTRDRAATSRVIMRFLEMQGDDLNGGLALRALLDLAPLGEHPDSGLPMSKEVRVFVLHGQPLVTLPYWPEASMAERPPETLVAELAARSRAPFVTLDLALRADGGWSLIELGDAQVSGLQGTRPEELYGALAAAVG